MRKLPPLSSLRAFEAAARHLNFGAAAVELAVTPTAISHQIRQLEAICGVALFRRRPRPLALTEAGAALFPRVHDAFEALGAAVAGIGAKVSPGPLRITTTNAFASRCLVPLLPLWRRNRPDIALEIIGTDNVVDIGAGEADCAIRYAREAPPGLASWELCRDRFWVMATPALLAAQPVHAPRDLLRHSLIHMAWQPGEPDPPDWRAWLTAVGLPKAEIASALAAGGLHFREELHAMEALIAGQGIAVCSDVLLAPELRDGVLVRAWDVSLPGFGFHLAHAADTPHCAGIEAFCAWLRPFF